LPTDARDRDLADLALAVAQEAGRMLLAGAGDIRPVATKTSSHDLVTQMDRASEALIRDRIGAVRPDDVILGEEEGASGEVTDPETVRWIVDPVDGTVNYFYGLPSWAVSIAAERDGLIRAGVVVAPALGEQYVATLGGGSWAIRDGQRHRLACSSVTRLDDAVVSTGFGYTRERRARQAQVVAAVLPQIRDIRRVGAAAVDLSWVGAGRLDAHYERGLQEWDRAAAGLIAREAGAVMGGLHGAPDSTDMTVVAPPALFAQLCDVLAGLAADQGP
jgi:myo-inositol-1(or 4)-monophosphatase